MENNQYILSIVIAAYNVDNYIKKCIDSIINASVEKYKYEVIIVDDGSNDKTGQIIDEYAMLYPNIIRVYHQENQGQTKARLKGIENSKSQYIWIIDSDDWVVTENIRKLFEVISINHPDIISFNYYKFVDNNSSLIKSEIENGIYNKDEIQKDIFPIMLYDNRKSYYSFGVFPTLWSKIFKRDLINESIKKINGSISIGEDAMCTFLSIINSKNICFVDYPLYCYRITPNSLTRKYIKDNFRKYYVLATQINCLFPYEMRSQIYAYKSWLLMACITNECRGEKSVDSIVSTIKYYVRKPDISDCICFSPARKMGWKKRMVWSMLYLKQYRVMVSILKKII